MIRVITREMIVPNMHLLTVEAPDVARKSSPVSSLSSGRMRTGREYRYPWPISIVNKER